MVDHAKYNLKAVSQTGTLSGRLAALSKSL